jgi:hypothetical protein
MKRLLSAAASLVNPPPFKAGDVVEFVPDDHALGWTQELEGLYPGYVGTVTAVVKGTGFEWDVFLDGKSVGFLSIYFKPARARPLAL